MKLGVLVPEYPSQTHIFMWREIEALRELGDQVSVLSTRRPPVEACRHEFAASARVETFYAFPPNPARARATLASRPTATLLALDYLAGLSDRSWRSRVRGLGLLFCAAEFLRYARRRGLEHIHVHSCAQTAHLAALTERLGGPSYSLTLHGDLPVYGSDHASKMARATFVSTDGPHLREQILEATDLPPERIIPNWMGLDTERFRDAGRAPGEPGRVRLLSVARLNHSKGHRYALAAMRRVLDEGFDLRYILVGEGPDRAHVEHEVRELGISDRVELKGTCSEAEILDELNRADVFVLPSIGIGEAGPISLMEAMACGLPAVVSIIGATPHMITDGVDGILVPQADVDGLATAFRRLAESPEERRRLGTAARQRATVQFDIRQTAARIREAIHCPPGSSASSPRASDRMPVETSNAEPLL